MKKTIPRFLSATLLIISIMLSVACDKTDTPPDITDVTSPSGGEMMTVPKESAMAIMALLDSDEMMYKFSYLDENKPEIQGVDSSCFIALCNETWDRRPFFTNRKWENVAVLGGYFSVAVFDKIAKASSFCTINDG